MDGLPGVFVAGFREVFDFVLSKAVGAFFPAFFIAGAMATLVSRQALVRYMAPRHGRVRSYGFATISGAFLTVCSCSVLPLFTAFADRGLAAGPSFTFLAATPAINPISVFYAYTLVGPRFGLGMVGVAAVMAILVGVLMEALLPMPTQELEEPRVLILGKRKRQPVHTVMLFVLMTMMVFVLPMSGVGPAFKAAWVLGNLVLVRLLVKARFEREEVEAWMDKSLDLMKKILPMILVGIFATGVLKHVLDPEGRVMTFLGRDDLLTCLVCSAVASCGYMGSIVCVTMVAGLLDLGMAPGPAMAILITGPGVSLATLLVVSQSVGRLRGWTYFILVILTAAGTSWAFGKLVGA